MQQYLPFKHEKWQWGAFKKRSLPMMDVQCPPPHTHTITSHLANPLCDESSWLWHKTVWWNAFACGWEWQREKSAGRWEMEALGAESVFFSFLCVCFFIFLIFKAYILESSTIAGSQKCFFFVGIIKSRASKCSGGWRKSIIKSEHTFIQDLFTENMLVWTFSELMQFLFKSSQFWIQLSPRSSHSER